MNGRVMPLRHLADVRVSNVDKKEKDDEVPIRLINYVDVYYGDKIVPELPLMIATASKSQIKAFTLNPGDVVITKDSESADDIGVPAFVERTASDMVCGYHLAILRPRSNMIDGRFLYWAFNSDDVRNQMESTATGVTRFGLRTDAINQIKLGVPSYSVQRSIADYLDTETARIDGLISKKRRLSDLFESRLMGLAEDAIKGCNSDKATGIPSLSVIPASWQVLRNKVFIREINHRSIDGNDEMLSVSHITGVTPRSEKTVYMFEAESTVGYKLVRPGDLVINTMWAWMGAAGVSDVHGIVSPAYGVYEFDDSIMLPKFYDILVRTPAYIAEMTRFSRGVTSSRLRLYPDEFLRLLSPVPPIKTQKAIIDRHASHESTSSQTHKCIAQQIQLLLERRQALITSVITGEMSVPGVAA